MELGDIYPSDSVALGETSDANTAPDVVFNIAVSGKHGNHICFSFSVPPNISGKEFMRRLHGFLRTTVFPNPHVRYHGWVARLLFSDTVEFGTASNVINSTFPSQRVSN